MTGEIVDFGVRKPSKDEDEKALADAKACFATHDPFQRVFDFLDRTTNRIEAAVQNSGGHPTTASALSDDQVKSLTYATERAAERGVGIYANRIKSWHQAIVGGAFVAGATIGIMATHYADVRQSAAEIDALRIGVPAVLSSIPAADLAEWTTLIRANSAPHALIAAGRLVPQTTGQRAANIAANITVWLEPPPPQIPAAH
jgi:hypothetical protein